MGKRKYNTEEERLTARRESNRKSARKWRERHHEENRENVRKWREIHPDYSKQQYEANKDYYLDKHKEWVKNNPELNKKMHKDYYDRNSDIVLEREKKYRSTQNGRAKNLCGMYRKRDIDKNRGECTITKEWIVDNIFSGQRCFYCDESDWHKLGCDRIDNSLTHTPENVVCCCEECNKKRGRKGFVEYLKEIGRLDKLEELDKKMRY